MIKKISAFAFFLILCSCQILQEKGIDFKIINSSNAPVTNVKVSTSENLDTIVFDSIAADQHREDFLGMKNNKTDGNFNLEFTEKGGKVVKKSFGYYSNGSTTEEWLRIEIKNDTTLIKFGDFPN